MFDVVLDAANRGADAEHRLGRCHTTRVIEIRRTHRVFSPGAFDRPPNRTLNDFPRFYGEHPNGDHLCALILCKTCGKRQDRNQEIENAVEVPTAL
jgi:hypothetical protein